MLDIKGIVDELALLGVSTDNEDLVIKVLNGLDDSYKELEFAIQARDSSISFEELHDKLLSTEAQIAQNTLPLIDLPTPLSRLLFPLIHSRLLVAGPPVVDQTGGQAPIVHISPATDLQRSSNLLKTVAIRAGANCGYLWTFSEAVSRSFSIHSTSACLNHSMTAAAVCPPTAHSTISTPSSCNWVLDSGASHHITTNLSNLFLHSPFDGQDSVVVVDGEGSEDWSHLVAGTKSLWTLPLALHSFIIYFSTTCSYFLSRPALPMAFSIR